MSRRNDLTIIRGDSKTVTVTVSDAAGDPYDLTDADMVMTVASLFAKSLDDGITVDDPPTGVASIVIDPADTDTAPGQRTPYPYDVQVTLSDGSVKTPIRGLFIVLPDVTR